MIIANNLRRIINKRAGILNQNYLSFIAKCSTNAFFHYDKDPGPSFTNPQVQQLLKSITRTRLERVFRKRAAQDKKNEYRFMTTEELDKEFRKISLRAEEELQMPPVVKINETTPRVISKDPALKDFSNTKYVFTDITFGLKQSERKVVIRQTDGTLEYAPQDVQKRMNQIYFPLPGRKHRTPRMFEPEHLKKCMDEYKYEFILNRLCVQYDPYEKEYHEICSKVYMHINENKKFDDLRSTRHFGPMAFFLAWHKTIDDLLYDMIKRDYLKNGVELIQLMYILNNTDHDKNVFDKLKSLPKEDTILDDLRKSIKSTTDDIHEEIKNAIGKSREDFIADDYCLEIIEKFVKEHSLKKVPLELAIQAYKESNEEKRRLYEGLMKAHGIN